MLLQPLFGVAHSPLILPILICVTTSISSAEILSPRAGLSLRRSTRQTHNTFDWILSAKGCIPKCRKGVSVEVCRNPPSRKQFCELIGNADWCCRDWLVKRPSAPFFLPDCHCRVACVAYNSCPYSTCRRCEEINHSHECCRNRKCAADSLLLAPDGSKPANRHLDSRSGDVSLAPANEQCTVDDDMPDTICSNYDGDAMGCRLASGCAYNCASATCLNSGLVYRQTCFDGCFNHCGDKCGCTGRPGCIWRSTGAGHDCKPNDNKYCRLSNFPDGECARKGVFYDVGGVLCESRVDIGDCDLDVVVAAVNLGSDKGEIDSRGIEYRPEQEIQKEDPLGLSQGISFPRGDIKTGSSWDQFIYSTAVVGSTTQRCQNDSRECVHYLIPSITLDGDYELALRMVEGVYSERLKRRFTVMFAGIDVLTEVDILGYAEEQYKPLDVHINFKVTQNASVITIKGNKARPLDATTKLSLCTAQCGEDNGFIMSAFHVIKQKKFVPRDPCKETRVPECYVSDFGGDECKRADGNSTFYSFGVKLCKSTTAGWKNAVNCAKHRVNKAVNLNGNSLVDSRNIRYEREAAAGNVEDKNGVKLGRNSLEPVQGLSDAGEERMYNTLVYADPAKLVAGEERCIRYEIKLSGDGKYELAVRTADDESDGTGQRKFSVFLGDLAVFPEVDLFHLTGKKSQAVDLTLNFQVTDQGRELHVKGFRPGLNIMDLPTDQKIWLSFCTSSCSNTKSTSFLVSSFSVIGFNQMSEEDDKKCKRFDGNPCACRFTTFCEYNVVTQGCTKREPSCEDPPEQQCRRSSPFGDVFYAVGGVICNQDRNQDPCTVKDTLMAVNFGAAGVAHTDVNGISYVKEDGIPFDDPFSVRRTGDVPAFLNIGYPPADMTLYKYVMWGDLNGRSINACVTYHVPTAGDGLYELNIKTGETTHAALKKRDFTYVFNGQEIAPSFEPAQYRLPPNAFSLTVNFKIFSLSSKLQMEGYPVTELERKQNPEIPLSFCPGKCKWPDVDHNWNAGAFSVVKFDRHLPCEVHNDESCFCRFQGGCEFNVVNGQCIERSVACNQKKGSGNECRRGGQHIFYADAGQICPSPVRSGNCHVEKIVFGVNFGDLDWDLTDVNGVFFQPDTDVIYEDSGSTKQVRAGESNLAYEGIPQSDKSLYNRYIWGMYSGPDTPPPCLAFRIPNWGDGVYEISIKTGEVYYKDPPPKRAFSIKLNGVYLVKDFEPGAYARAPKAMDLNAIFRISGGKTKFALSGHPQVDITASDLSLPFELCFGSCEWRVDTNWLLGGLSVVKFVESRVLCQAHKDDSCSCRYQTGCEFNTVNGQCVERTTACSQKKAIDDNECRRGGPHIFYVDAGEICPNTVGTGKCDLDKVLFGVNFGDFNGVHKDVNGITFRTDKNIRYDDPGSTKQVYPGESKLAYQGIPQNDKTLYNRYIWGNYTGPKTPQPCLTFLIPTDGEGVYEISIKTGEVLYREPPPNRAFSIKLNGVYLVKDFEPGAYARVPNAFDLNAIFRISEDGSKFTLSGHSEVEIKSRDKSLPFELCFGSCDWRMENAWILGALSVVKFRAPSACTKFHGDSCGCRLLGECEYNTALEQCVDRHAACSQFPHPTDECRRSWRRVFNVNAGVICPSPGGRGDCSAAETLIAANFGEKVKRGFQDVNQIFFEPFRSDRTPIRIRDPEHTLQFGESTFPYADIPNEAQVSSDRLHQEQSLYDQFIWGKYTGQGSPPPCLSIVIPIKNDGKYEISLKSAEVFERDAARRRTFTVKLNGVVLVKDFEPRAYSSVPNILNLNAIFRISQGNTKFTLSGHPEVDKTSDVLLELCFGSCEKGQADNNWNLGSLSVVRFRS